MSGPVHASPPRQAAEPDPEGPRSGGHEQSDWVRKLQANGQVTVELGDETHAATAHGLQPGTVEDQRGDRGPAELRRPMKCVFDMSDEDFPSETVR